MSPASSAPEPAPLLVPALQVGALAGCAGFVAGGIAAVLRSKRSPGWFALGTGANCFIWGTSYWVIRSTLFRALGDPASAALPPMEKVYISGASGALTGVGMGLLRGKSHVVPGMIVWGVVGLGGQYAYNAVDAWHTEQTRLDPAVERKPSPWDRILRSQRSPVRRLTDDEYKRMLDEKLLAVDAEIAITDGEIKELEQKLRESKK